MKRSVILVLLVTAIVGLIACSDRQHVHPFDPPAADPLTAYTIPDDHVHRPTPGPDGLMVAKLAHAQAVLEGIALDDFEQVQKNAHRLTALSQKTDWQVHRTLDYTVFSTEFRRITQDMARNADARNLHAVTLDYMQMVMTCVKCHSYMRSEGLAQMDIASPLATIHQP